MQETRYRDRADAGRKLAEHLKHWSIEDPIVLGLPRGGVVVAREVAEALNAPLDVLVARKIGAPSQPEFGIGAVAASGELVINQTAADMDISPEQIKAAAEPAEREALRRQQLYRGTDKLVDLKGRTAIIVDDGLATGVTAQAAIASARRCDPKHIIFAVPVGSRQAVEQFQNLVDEVVCPLQPENFRAVGAWYDEFNQVEDDEVEKLLSQPVNSG